MPSAGPRLPTTKLASHEGSLQQPDFSFTRFAFDFLHRPAGKTAKMYRGGKICLTIHFKPLWAKNVPHFGIAHALCLGLAPWMAAEIPHLIETGVIRHKDDAGASKPAAS